MPPDPNRPETPAAAPWSVSGPSFPMPLKLLAGAMLAVLLFWVLRAAAAAPPGERLAGGAGLLLAALGVVAVGFWEVATSRTEIDERAIRQRSLWSREVELAEIMQLKLLHLRGLEGLVVPRLVVRTHRFGLATFRAGDARLLAAFRRLVDGEVG